MNVETMNRATEWVPANFQPWLLMTMIGASAGMFLTGVWLKLAPLRQARSEMRWDRIGERLGRTARIAFGQSKLFKDRGPGWMHALIFWGFLALLLRASQFFAIGLFPQMGSLPEFLDPLVQIYGGVKDVFVLLVSLAVMYGLYRRLVVKPERLTLSLQGVLILLLILVIMLSDVAFDGAWMAMHTEADHGFAPLGWLSAQLLFAHLPSALNLALHELAYWTHVSAILVFACMLPHSKHFHIVTSIPNVFFSRLDNGSGLRRIDFEDEDLEAYGVSEIRELSWKQLFDLHTCTECGRCDSVCPAFNSGKPLSPKQLTIDLREHLDAVSAGQGDSVELLGGVIQDETLWSCTSCGACEEACPVMIEYVDKIIEMKQGLVMMESRFPKELNDAFKSLEVNSNPWGFGGDSRADWAEGLDVKLWDKNAPTEYLYFVGCNGSFDHRGKKISQSVVGLLNRAGVDFSILGKSEGCTGDPARRAGNEYLFDMLASSNAETFNEQGVKKVVTHCPHCFNSLKNEYPEFGANLEVIHHSELLNDLVKEGKLEPGEQTGDAVVMHDSCYLGRHNDEYDAPRGVLNAGAKNVREVETSRENGTCCGAGGARFLMEETQGTRMSYNRIDELMATNPKTIAVSCPFCVLMLEDGLKAKQLDGQVKVQDISEVLGL